MRLFGKKQRKPADHYVPFLTPDQGARLRWLLSQSFARRGTPVVVAGDHVRTSEGQVLAISRVAAACVDAGGEKAWARAVDEQVGRFVGELDRLAPDGASARLG